MTFRVRASRDLATIKAFQQRLFGTKDEVEGNDWWVATDTVGSPVGFATARASKKEKGAAFLSRCGVSVKARGNGLQRRFIRARVAWARKRGFRRAVTYCMLGNVASARNLIREGFLPYWPKKRWAGDAWYFEKDLRRGK